MMSVNLEAVVVTVVLAVWTGVEYEILNGRKRRPFHIRLLHLVNYLCVVFLTAVAVAAVPPVLEIPALLVSAGLMIWYTVKASIQMKFHEINSKLYQAGHLPEGIFWSRVYLVAACIRPFVALYAVVIFGFAVLRL
jgi:hypothetical protein